MRKISVKKLKKEGWINFELVKEDFLFTQKEVDEIVRDTYKWVLKLNVKKLKENEKFMKRVQELPERKQRNV